MYIGKENTRESKIALYVAAWIAVSVFFILFLRLWYLQVFKGNYFRELAENNRIRIVRTAAPRGIIFDRYGKVLVENRPSFTLSVTMEDVVDIEKVKKSLANLVNISQEDIDARIKVSARQPLFQPVRIKEDITWDEIAKIEVAKIDLPGVALEIEPRRRYLYEDLITHLIGYMGEINEEQLKRFNKVDYRPGDYLGKYGVEEKFEDYLKGVHGTQQTAG
ncbi:MAG: hypothetical protein HZC45_03250 [Deltaproteobacteria bacterium]|nr:hypothetical protein [Deltaproteobacteria bacterium]